MKLKDQYLNKSLSHLKLILNNIDEINEKERYSEIKFYIDNFYIHHPDLLKKNEKRKYRDLLMKRAKALDLFVKWNRIISFSILFTIGIFSIIKFDDFEAFFSNQKLSGIFFLILSQESFLEGIQYELKNRGLGFIHSYTIAINMIALGVIGTLFSISLFIGYGK